MFWCFEATLETSNNHRSALESQGPSMDTEMALNVEQGHSLEGCVKTSKEGTSLMLVTVCEHDPQLRTAQATFSSTEVARHSTEYQLQVFRGSSCLCRRRWVDYIWIVPY